MGTMFKATSITQPLSILKKIIKLFHKNRYKGRSSTFLQELWSLLTSSIVNKEYHSNSEGETIEKCKKRQQRETAMAFC